MRVLCLVVTLKLFNARHFVEISILNFRFLFESTAFY